MPLRNKFEIFMMMLVITGCTFSMGITSGNPLTEGEAHHYVRRGETLFRISRYYYSADTVRDINSGVERIKEANSIPDGQISVGQRLLIPGTSKQQPAYALLPPAELVSGQPEEISPGPEDKTGDVSPIIKPDSFLWPVTGGRIISGFGELGNQGIDILVDPGIEVKASESGTVIFAGQTTRYQETIIIVHPGDFYTVYGHDLIINVTSGQEVEKGMVIGTIKSGSQRIRYLHFEIRFGDRPVNPVNYLKDPDKNDGE